MTKPDRESELTKKLRILEYLQSPEAAEGSPYGYSWLHKTGVVDIKVLDRMILEGLVTSEGKHLTSRPSNSTFSITQKGKEYFADHAVTGYDSERHKPLKQAVLDFVLSRPEFANATSETKGEIKSGLDTVFREKSNSSRLSR